MEQVIMNLVVNARDAMPRGGQLTIETANVEMDQTFAAQRLGAVPGSYAMLAVSDNGNGMDAATQARIFEPFFTTKKPGQGTGLGLATVYGIVKQSGGSIWVYSEVGCGTTFKVYLPRVEEVAEEPAPGAEALPRARPGETVLLVEDEDGVRDFVRSVLERQGYAVLAASDGARAVELAGRHEGAIHLVLTDVVMPDMSGRELAERVRATRPQVKLLFMSGYTDDAVVQRGVLASDMAFLQKPFSGSVLARKVRRAIEGT
jgi:CheY-like chemotaxis protein